MAPRDDRSRRAAGRRRGIVRPEVLDLASALVAGVLFLLAGQMVAWADGQLALLVTTDRLAAFAVLAVLTGLNGTLQG